jgi:hypothetical protein
VAIRRIATTDAPPPKSMRLTTQRTMHSPLVSIHAARSFSDVSIIRDVDARRVDRDESSIPDARRAAISLLNPS